MLTDLKRLKSAIWLNDLAWAGETVQQHILFSWVPGYSASSGRFWIDLLYPWGSRLNIKVQFMGKTPQLGFWNACSKAGVSGMKWKTKVITRISQKGDNYFVVLSRIQCTYSPYIYCKTCPKCLKVDTVLQINLIYHISWIGGN